MPSIEERIDGLADISLALDKAGINIRNLKKYKKQLIAEDDSDTLDILEGRDAECVTDLANDVIQNSLSVTSKNSFMALDIPNLAGITEVKDALKLVQDMLK